MYSRADAVQGPASPCATNCLHCCWEEHVAVLVVSPLLALLGDRLAVYTPLFCVSMPRPLLIVVLMLCRVWQVPVLPAACTAAGRNQSGSVPLDSLDEGPAGAPTPPSASRHAVGWPEQTRGHASTHKPQGTHHQITVCGAVATTVKPSQTNLSDSTCHANHVCHKGCLICKYHFHMRLDCSW